MTKTLRNDPPLGRFFQASKCLIPPFSANFHPSVQNSSILQLIYQVAKQGDPIAESAWKHLSAIQWEHIHLVGAYHFTDVKLEGEFRPLREYQGKRSEQEKMAKIAQIDEGQENIREESMDETLPLIQLSLLSPDDAVS